MKAQIIPKGWSQIQLKDCLDLVNGRAYKQKELLKSGTPVLRIQNLNGKQNWYYSDLQLPEDKYCDKNDLLFAWSATFGPYIWQGDKCIYHYHIWKVKPKENLDKKFAFYLLKEISNAVKQAAHGITMLHITKAKMEAWKVSLPPIAEQRRIAAILDKADEIRRKRSQAIQLTEDLGRSLFLDMFGDPVTNPQDWEKIELEQVLNNIESGWSPKCESRIASKDEWGVLKLGAITWGTFNENENKALLPDTKPTQELEVKQGDLLFARKNTYELVGATAYVSSTRDKLILPDLIFRLKLNKKVDPVYLWQALSQNSSRKEISRLASGSSGSMPNISKARLRKLLITLPPIKKQEEYHKKVRKYWCIQKDLNRYFKESEFLFNSLLQRAFRGEL